MAARARRTRANGAKEVQASGSGIRDQYSGIRATISATPCPLIYACPARVQLHLGPMSFRGFVCVCVCVKGHMLGTATCRHMTLLTHQQHGKYFLRPGYIYIHILLSINLCCNLLYKWQSSLFEIFSISIKSFSIAYASTNFHR